MFGMAINDGDFFDGKTNGVFSFDKTLEEESVNYLEKKEK